MKDIYLSLGSNLGNREENLNDALEKIQERGAVLRASSSIYKTQAWGNVQLKEFLNMVVELEWDLQPMVLLEELQNIESEVGRSEGSKDQEFYQDRPIDIDILFFGDLIIDSKKLILPHPRLKERLFVLEPMNEIASDYQDPRSKKRISFLLEECTDTNKVEKLT